MRPYLSRSACTAGRKGWRVGGGRVLGWVAAAVTSVLIVASCGGDGGPPVGIAALGDSFSSGEGAEAAGEAYRPGTASELNGCHRSDSAFPMRIARALEVVDVAFLACSGATTEHLLDARQFTEQPPQVDSLREFAADEGVGFVTLTAGGNDVGRVVLGGDAGFGRIMGLCAVPLADCVGRYEDRVVEARSEVGTRLSEVLDAIRRVVGDDTPIYVFGYARILPARGQQGCLLLATFDDEEKDFIEDTWFLLNETVRSAALAADAHYVDVHQAFDRHLVCSHDPYAHGVIFGTFGEVIGGRIVVPDSFHPTPEGHACLTDVFFALHPDPYEPAHEPDQSPEVGSTPPCP